MKSTRPLLLIGGGVDRKSGKEILGKFKDLGFPLATTWNGFDRVSSEYEFYAYYTSDFAEPFCAIYSARGLQKVLKMAQQNLLKTFSLQGIFKNGATQQLLTTNPSVFKSYNQPLLNDK
jgi:hypothetical protein